MSALAQQAPVDAAEIFNNAVRAIFSRWTLLRLAVDQGWADGDEAQKADALVTRVLEMVAPSVRRNPDESEIADVLHDAIEGTFNAQAEDGSVEEIAKPDFKARMTVRLAVAGAFHTDFMAPAVDALAAALKETDVASPRIPVVSNVDAKPHSDPDVIKDLLAKQVTSPVLWEDGVAQVLGNGFEKGYELGPGKVISGIFKRIDKTAEVENVVV